MRLGARAQPQHVELQLVQCQRARVELRGDRVASFLHVLRAAALAFEIRQPADALFAAMVQRVRHRLESTDLRLECRHAALASITLHVGQ